MVAALVLVPLLLLVLPSEQRVLLFAVHSSIQVSSCWDGVDLYGPSASVVFGEAACLYVSTSLNPISQAKRSMKVVGLFGLGVPELVVVAGVAVLLFGPKKLPEIGKTLGKTMKSFQQAADEFKTELKDETEFSTSNSEIPPAESISEKENAEKKV
ncbi:hypothetical protein O6H91_16G047600 [Diphasiastrum complanatum]|uniref:Uncharacterized protein n=1 Tax=Diphasiastrum complanatum TaxID=34168 RepID=A0ACC2BC04_DIPCM|nr:hypothetical protein O6H91_16G047600 [Diphasiastrum complanatum]